MLFTFIILKLLCRFEPLSQYYYFFLNILIYNLLQKKLTENLNFAILVDKGQFYLLLQIKKYVVQYYN